jgi:hypothetical protein
MKHRLNSNDFISSRYAGVRSLRDWVLRASAGVSLLLAFATYPTISAAQAPRISELSASAATAAFKNREIDELVSHLQSDKGYAVDPQSPLRSKVISGKQADTSYEIRLISRDYIARTKGTPKATVSLTQIIVNGKVQEAQAIAEIAGVAYKSEGAARSWHWPKWTFDLGRARNCVSAFARNGVGPCRSCYQQLSACINNYSNAGWWGTLSCVYSAASSCYTCFGAIYSFISCLSSCWHWV